MLLTLEKQMSRLLKWMSFIHIFPYSRSKWFFFQVTYALYSLSIFMCGLQPVTVREMSVLWNEREK